MPRRPKDFTDLLDMSYRWPSRGDRLLRDTNDWNRGVTFPQNELSRDVHLWSGYMRAGAALIEACDNDLPDRHFLIYPILFNYRHGIELAMKSIIVRYGSFSSVQVEATNHHDLWQLWKVCKAIIIEVGAEDEAIPVVEQVIKDFHDLDKSALAFRYSRDRRGALIALPDGMIDLENLRNVMEGVGHFFGGADAQLDANSSALDWN